MPESLELLVARLAAPLQADRDQARAAIISRGPAAVPLLRRALGHSERDLRVGAALCLGSLGADPAAAELAQMAAGDPDPSARPLALRALADLARPGSPPEVAEALLDGLSSPDLFARALACTGLGRIGLNDPRLRQALEQASKDPEQWVRQAARAALAASAAQPPSTEGPADPPAAEPAPSQALVPRSANEPALARLVGQLRSLELPVQEQAARELRAHGPAAARAAAPLLQDEMATTRRAAVELIAAVGDAQSIAPLLASLAEDSLRPGWPIVLHGLAALLQRHRLPARLDLGPLLGLLDDADPLLRAAACAVLIAAGPATRLLAGTAALEDPDPWVRRSGLRALAVAATPEDQELALPLLELLDREADAEAEALLYAVQALERLIRDPAGAEALPLEAVLSGLLWSEEEALRWGAGRILARAAAQLSTPQLQGLLELAQEDPLGGETLLEQARRLFGPRAQATVPTLRDLMHGSHQPLACLAAELLAVIGGEEAIAALLALANSQAGPIVAVAAQALAGLDPKAQACARRQADGRWELLIQHWCTCGSLLAWQEQGSREELRCTRCGKEHVLSQAGKLYAAQQAPLGLCCCKECRRRQLLVRQQDSETLVCPQSGQIHIRPFDHPQQLRLLAELPLGACQCCIEPQPLVRLNDTIVCYRSRRRYEADDRGFSLAEPRSSPAQEVEAINRALLMGTLGIAESGLAAGAPQLDPLGAPAPLPQEDPQDEEG